ncbi:MAG: gamma-glutamyl-gamma-aminobutyrate hydrolase family protein, partial [Trebonia sp.]
SLARGGSLIQDLPGHRPDPVKYQPHDVRINGESLLGRLLGTSLTVLAAHHQAPAPGRLGDGITLAGWAPADETAEAIEVNGHRFAIGVQWHPEEGDDPRLLEAFVVAAAEPRRQSPSSRDSRQPGGQAGGRKPGKVRTGASRR